MDEGKEELWKPITGSIRDCVDLYHYIQANFIFTKPRSRKQLASIILAESISTIIFMSLGCFSSVQSLWDHTFVPHFQIALGFGFAYTVAIEFGGLISGAHVNPCITLAACLLGKKPWLDLPLYTSIHFVGSVLGAGLAMLTTGVYSSRFLLNKGVNFCSSTISPHFTANQAFMAEFTATYILILVCCGIWDSRCRGRLDSISIKLGLTLVGLHMAFGSITGCHMNPARSFSAAVVGLDFSRDLIIYMMAPIAGTTASVVTYRFFFAKNYREEMIEWRIEILPPLITDDEP